MIQQIEIFFKNIMQNPVISTTIKIVLIYYACIIAPKLNPSNIIIVNSCGDSIKDKYIIKKRLGNYRR